MMVRYEDGKWINNIGVYFEILKEINEDLLQLIKFDGEYEEKIELLFFKIAVNFNRIFPIKAKKISNKDGILKLKESIDFIESDYEEIYILYKDYIITINDLRNKFEHVPHIIRWKQFIGNNKEKKMWFINEEYQMNIFEGKVEEINRKKEKGEKSQWYIDTDMLIKIIILLDKVFIKIQDKLKNYFKDDAKALTHPYISRILNLNILNYINELNNV